VAGSWYVYVFSNGYLTVFFAILLLWEIAFSRKIRGCCFCGVLVAQCVVVCPLRDCIISPRVEVWIQVIQCFTRVFTGSRDILKYNLLFTHVFTPGRDILTCY
jgi:hypothetical protein